MRVAYCNKHLFLSLVLATLVAGIAVQRTALAAEPSQSMEDRIEALIPDLEAYIGSGMKVFDVPGLAIGIVADDKLIYAKGFGTRSKGGEPVNTKTIFQIGSATKAFLAATLAIAVDQGKLH
jgi:CubicO group peptidase (beta-lactamase class C family)